MHITNRGPRRRTLDARAVKQEARGRWLPLLDRLAPALKEAASKPGRHVPCPVHGGKDGFRLFRNVDDTGGGVCNTCGTFDDGMALLQWVNEQSFPDVVEAVGEALGMKPSDPSKPNPAPRSLERVPVEESEEEKRKRAYKDKRCREELNRVWKEAVKPSAPEAEPLRLYLARRGLSLQYALECDWLKFHPKMSYFEKEGGVIGEFPCIVALAFDAKGEPVTIHRTYLTWEGKKAPVPEVKKLMAYPSDRKLSGGGIPLMNIKNHIGNAATSSGAVITAIGVTEGIETALAVIEASKGKLPVWPLISTRLMENFEPPEEADLICIYGDQDANEAGKKAAIRLKERMIESGKMVCGWLPPEDLLESTGSTSVDWLDVLIHQGEEHIPLPSGIGDEDEIAKEAKQ